MNITLTKKILISLIIFTTTLLTFGLSVDKIWYREDDLGQIINGIMRSKEDVVRVFSADEREFIVPVNFKRSKANVISGFLRPIKNIFFTGIYYFWGLNVKAYLWQHVTLHALNAMLFFWLLILFLPLGFATLGGFLFAFYPDNSWLVWIAATHNSLSTLFLLLTLLLYHQCFFEKKHTQVALLTSSALIFLLSLLSRENAIFFPFWLFFGVWLYTKSLKKACTKTWVFFVVNILYVLIRLWAFGIQTLDRTFYNLSLRFPTLTKLLPTNWFVAQTPSIALPATIPITPSTSIIPEQTISWVTTLTHKATIWLDAFFSWSSIMFCLNNQTTTDKMIILTWWVLLITLCWHAYKNRFRLLLFFIIGFYCFSWQAFLAYPAARYINSAYPIIIAVILFGLHYTKHVVRPIFYLVLACTGYSLATGIHNNITRMHAHASGMTIFEDRYAQFFAKHSFPKGTNFILLGSPFVSDIQNIFQYFMGDLTVSLAHELFATVAEQGYFGCRGDYHSSGVPSTIEEIPEGFRFISHDEKHCAWWMHFSDHPMHWSKEDGAYRWASQPYEIGIWHDSPLGTFKINKIVDNLYVTDISFTIDKKWLNKNTVIISWDTQQGKYIVLNNNHIKASTL